MQNLQNKKGLYLWVQPLSAEDTSAYTRTLSLLESRLPCHPQNAAYLRKITDSPAPVRVRLQRVSALLALTELLANVLPSAWDTLCLDRDEYGRPYAQTERSCPLFDFNLSHTDGLAVCALLLGEGRVGVDAERLLSYDRAYRLTERFYTEGEKKRLSACGSETAYAQETTRLWTVREAVSKQDGRGDPLRCDGLCIPSGLTLHSFRYAHPNGSTAMLSLCAPQGAGEPVMMAPCEGSLTVL